MEKKEYMSPETTVVTVVLQQMIAFSGGSQGIDEPTVDPNADESDEPNRSRRTYNCWVDEEEEDW
ncbi:MAG: hypothetical protein IJT53_04320 [Prevotella sp.]|nr:hypothetical protein [Prevotella sp.]